MFENDVMLREATGEIGVNEGGSVSLPIQCGIHTAFTIMNFSLYNKPAIGSMGIWLTFIHVCC